MDKQVTVDVPEDVNWVMVRRDGKVCVPTLDHHRLLWRTMALEAHKYSRLLGDDSDSILPAYLGAFADNGEHLTGDILSWMYGGIIGKMGEMADLDSNYTASRDEVDYSSDDDDVATQDDDLDDNNPPLIVQDDGELLNIQVCLSEDGTLRVYQEGMTIGVIPPQGVRAGKRVLHRG